MTSSVPEPYHAEATAVHIARDTLTVELRDGDTVSVPLWWFPRLCDASEQEQANRVLTVGGQAIRWPDLDEDILVDHLLRGTGPSGESTASLGRWLLARRSGRDITPEALARYHGLDSQRPRRRGLASR